MAKKLIFIATVGFAFSALASPPKLTEMEACYNALHRLVEPTDVVLGNHIAVVLPSKLQEQKTIRSGIFYLYVGQKSYACPIPKKETSPKYYYLEVKYDSLEKPVYVHINLENRQPASYELQPIPGSIATNVEKCSSVIAADVNGALSKEINEYWTHIRNRKNVKSVPPECLAIESFKNALPGTKKIERGYRTNAVDDSETHTNH